MKLKSSKSEREPGLREPSHHPGLRRRLVESLAWLGGSTLLSQGVSWLATLVVIRLLHPEDYGLVALGGIVFSLMLQAFDFGIGTALIQTRDLSREDVRSAQSLVLALGACAGVGVAGLGGLVAVVYSEPRLTAISLVLGTTVILAALSIVPQSLAIRELRFDLKARADLVSALCSSAVTFGLAFHGAGYWALVAGIVATYLSRALVYWSIGGARVWPARSLAFEKRVLHFGGLLSLDRLLWFAFTNVDLILVGTLLGEDVLGVYVVTLTLCSLPLDKLSPLFTQVALPAVARVQDEPTLIRSAALAGMRYALLLFVPLAWGAAMIAPEALPIVLGDQWQETVLPFQLICLILPLRSLSALMSTVLIGSGLLSTNAGNLAITFAVMSASYLVGVRHGLHGMGFAWLIGFTLVSALTLSRTWRALGIPLQRVFGAARCAVGAGAAMVAAVAVVRLVATEDPQILLPCAVGIGAAVYLGAVLWLEPGLVDEIRDLIRPSVFGAQR